MVNRRQSESEAPSRRIEDLCVAHGLRMTEQRRTIARVLDETADHPDVEEVYRRASNVDAQISMSTVYRTLRLFAEKGILERHDFGAGRSSHRDHRVTRSTARACASPHHGSRACLALGKSRPVECVVVGCGGALSLIRPVSGPYSAWDPRPTK